MDMHLHKSAVHLIQWQKMSILANGFKIGVYLPLTIDNIW